MSIVLKQFVNSTVTPIDDAILYQHFDSRAGILSGCAVSISGTSVHVGAGRGVICGRVFQIVAENVPAVLGANKLGRLLIRVDTANVSTPISFVAQAANPLPALTQEDINRGGTVYEMPLATYDVSASSISNIVRVAPVLPPLSDLVDGKANASGYTASRALVSNSAGKLIALNSVSTTELGYLDGVTGNIQTQLNGKANAFTFDSAPTANSGNAVTSGGVYSSENPPSSALTADKTLALSDAGKFYSCSGANITIIVPTNSVAFPLGTEILFQRASSYTVTFAPASGVTIRTCGTLTITSIYSVACLKKITATVWLLFGHVE